jgi:hypothetical protein
MARRAPLLQPCRAITQGRLRVARVGVVGARHAARNRAALVQQTQRRRCPQTARDRPSWASRRPPKWPVFAAVSRLPRGDRRRRQNSGGQAYHGSALPAELRGQSAVLQGFCDSAPRLTRVSCSKFCCTVAVPLAEALLERSVAQSRSPGAATTTCALAGKSGGVDDRHRHRRRAGPVYMGVKGPTCRRQTTPPGPDPSIGPDYGTTAKRFEVFRPDHIKMTAVERCDHVAQAQSPAVRALQAAPRTQRDARALTNAGLTWPGRTGRRGVELCVCCCAPRRVRSRSR